MKYLFELGFIVLNILMAIWHAHLIKQNRPINHGLWVCILYVFYVPVAIIVWSHERSLLMNVLYLLKWFFIVAFIREVFFSPVLNFIRHKPFFYINPNPNGSKIDNFERDAAPYIFFASIVILTLLQIKL